MRNQTENGIRNLLIFYCMALMLLCLFLSRAALSISIILFCVIATLHPHLTRQLKNFFKNPFLVLMSMLFWLPFVSGLWSEDRQQWWNVVQLKLPYLFFPLAFAGDWKLHHSQWLMLAKMLIVLVFISCIPGIVDYLSTMPAIHENYLRAKLIETPLENDHVRFSWLVSMAVMLCVLLMLRDSTKFRWIWIVFGLLLGIYLHLLAARMGLISLYLFLLIYGGYTLIGKTDRKYAHWYFMSLQVLPFVAWMLLPTFQNRIDYIKYDLDQVRNNRFVEGSNDGARFYSMAAGWDILKAHPFGIGAGDVPEATDQWFDTHKPQVKAEDRLMPMNEWLMYGAYAGWIGVVIISLVILYPFFIKTSYQIFNVSLMITIAVGAMVDMFFEVQYGIFLSAFILLWWYKWLKPSP